jgi:hypothetical protein
MFLRFEELAGDRALPYFQLPSFHSLGNAAG